MYTLNLLTLVLKHYLPNQTRTEFSPIILSKVLQKLTSNDFNNNDDRKVKNINCVMNNSAKYLINWFI